MPPEKVLYKQRTNPWNCQSAVRHGVSI